MEYRISQKQLSLIHHIASLEKNSLANEIFAAQRKYNFPGLVSTCSEKMEELGLPNIMDDDILSDWNKSRWKRMVKRRIMEKCEDDLKESMKAYSKLRDGPMPNEEFKMKNYIKEMTVEDARTNFSIRSFMYRAKFNYRSDPKNV